MKKPIFVIAISLAFIFALAMPRRDASAQRGNSPSADKLARARDKALRVIEAHANRKGLAGTAISRPRASSPTSRKKRTRVFNRRTETSPVFGGEAIVHLNPDESVFAVTDDLVESVAG
jgi:hypothetical protein